MHTDSNYRKTTDGEKVISITQNKHEKKRNQYNTGEAKIKPEVKFFFPNFELFCISPYFCIS